MHALNGEEILIAWEGSRNRHEQEAALSLLALAWPERSTSELAALPLAERNALLLELRAATLGRQMEGRAVCPECGVQLEFELNARALAQGLRQETQQSGAECMASRCVRPIRRIYSAAPGQAMKRRRG